jgi:endo-1,4-beta-xylanase
MSSIKSPSKSLRAVLAVLVLLTIAAGAIAQDFTPVVVADQGFENGDTFKWVTRGGAGQVDLVNDVAHSGKSSLKMSGRTVDWHCARIELTSILERGSKYRIELWARLAAGEKDGPMTLSMLTRYPDKDDEVEIAKADASANGWVLLAGEYVYDPTAAGSFLYVFNKGSVTGSYLIDDVKITKIAEKVALPGQKLDVFSYDFETDTQGWGQRGSTKVEVLPAAAHSGKTGLSGTGRGANWHGPAIAMVDILKSQAVYDFSAWVRLAAKPGSPSTVKFTMEEKTGGKTDWKQVALAEIKDDQWVKLAGSYTFKGAMDQLTLYLESSNPGDDLYVDDIEIKMVTPPPAGVTIKIQKDLKPVKDGFVGVFTVGCAITPELIKSGVSDLVVKHFNSVVAENAMKPMYVHPKEDTYFWDDADAIVKYAKENTMYLRFHTLQWHEQCPNWFFLDADGKEMVEETDKAKQKANKKLLLKRLEDHITTIVSRYKNDVNAWDVVNEVIDPSQPDGLRRSKWYQIAGKDFIYTAFKAARKAAGDKGKLYILDYQTYDPAKLNALVKLVKELKRKRIPIDGVAHQNHININQPPMNQIVDSIKVFGEMGLDNQITELDMSIYTENVTAYASAPQDLLVRQGYRYKELFEEFKKLNDYISNVTFWGVGDARSWLQNRPIKRADAPLLFDLEYQAKPAYYGIMNPSLLPPKPPAMKPKNPPKLGEAVFGTPKIDGAIDDAWKNAKTFDVDKVIEGKTDTKGTGKVMWDENFIYVLMEVKDAVLNKAAANVYEHDSVEVFLDENNEKTQNYQGEDAQYRVNFENLKSYGSNGEDKRFASAAKVVDGGYVVEMAVPLKSFKGKEGVIVGFDLQINEADATGKRTGIIKWNDLTNEGWRNTLNYGELKLVK